MPPVVKPLAPPVANPGGIPATMRSVTRGGVIVKVSGDGREIVLESPNGNKETVRLPANVRVQKFTDFSAIQVGNRIHALLGGPADKRAIQRAMLNPDQPPRHPPYMKDGKLRKDPNRVFGTVTAVDAEARRITIQEEDGMLVTLPVAEKVRMMATLSADALEKGDRVVLLSRGGSGDGAITTVIVQPGKATER